MIVMGLNCAYHEDSVTILADGNILASIERERINRKRHGKFSMVDNSDDVPFEAIDVALDTSGIRLAEVDWIGSSIDPVERILRNHSCRSPYPVPEGDWGSPRGEQLFYRKTCSIPSKLEERYQIPVVSKFIPLRHHLCHGASAYYASPFSDSAVMVIDGIGEFASAWFGFGENVDLWEVEGLAPPVFPHSLGMIWDRIVEFLGFHPYDSSHVMALAPYGGPSRLQTQLRRLILDDTGSAIMAEELVWRLREEVRNKESFQANSQGWIHEVSARLGMDPRAPNSVVTKDHKDLAFAAQELLQEQVVRMARALREKTGSRRLSYAGGVALNCVANYDLAERAGFEDIFVQPAANDAGTSLGAAYVVDQMIARRTRILPMQTAQLGTEYTDMEMEQAIMDAGLVPQRPDGLPMIAAAAIARGQIIGWFQGRMEWGPRALGGRSLLADPRRETMRDEINMRVKRRESFRPFAPSVLADEAEEWFDVPRAAAHMADYMLVACPVKEHQRSRIPAVLHVDGSARLHRVHREWQPGYYELIERFREITGVPMLLNTSFNDNEPIVCRPEEAIATARRAGLDLLVMGPFLVECDGR